VGENIEVVFMSCQSSNWRHIEST